MEDNENVVLEGTENVDEQATESLVDGSSVAEATETVEEKLYTQADIDRLVNAKVDELLPKKLERAKSKMQRENMEKYGRLETVLRAGLRANGNKNVNSIEDITNTFDSFYKSKGVPIPEQPSFSETDLAVLANAEANEIINSGYEDLVEEVDRLAGKGLNNMTAREKLVFTKLAEERTKQESIKELAQIGVKLEALEDSDYKEFADKLNPSLSAKEKYELYLKVKPKPKVETIGSMKGANSKDNGVKDFYTYEESLKFTKADFDKNPELFKAVEKSMHKW